MRPLVLLKPEATTRGVSKKAALNFCNIHRKASVMESFFNKVAGLQDFRTSPNGCFCKASMMKI